MKKTLLQFVMMIAFFGVAFAQSPEAINYQAVARDAAGDLITNGNLDLRIGIYYSAGAANLAYEETHAVTTDERGTFSIKIGEGVATTGLFNSIDWGSDEHHLKVEVDLGSGFMDLGTSELVATPYSYYADKAGTATDMSLNDLTDVNTVGLGVGEVLTWSGSGWDNSPASAGPWNTNAGNIYYDAGYVGIGTNNPGAGLALSSAAGYGSAVALKNTGGGLEWRLTSWTDGTFRVVKTSGTTFSPLVIEPVDGYIGIGTSTPDQPLSVHTSSGISYIRVSDNTTGPSSGLRMGLSGSGNAYIINDEGTKSLSLGTSGTSQMRITDIGRVGINELTPDQMLHVRQDAANKGIRTQHQSTTDYWETGVGTTTKNYKFYYNNLFRADISSVDGAYTQSSDKRLKKDIEMMGNVLSKVNMLQPATYHYIDNTADDVRSTGFVAQDVAPIFPDLVRDTDDGYKGLVYDGFAVISIKAIQELDDKIESMQAEIDALKEALNK